MTERKPDFEIELTNDELCDALGEYCVRTLRRLPAGRYERTVLIITGSAGEEKIVFRAWAQPGVLSEPIPMHIAQRDVAAGELATTRDVKPIPTITVKGESVPTPVGVYAGDEHPALRRAYEPEPNEPEPESTA